MVERSIRPGLLFPLLGIALSCGGGTAGGSYEVLSGDAAPLRSAFEADYGKVRAIFLASPT